MKILNTVIPSFSAQNVCLSEPLIAYTCIFICFQLQAVGKDLELNDKEKMEGLMEKFRSKIIRNG